MYQYKYITNGHMEKKFNWRSCFRLTVTKKLEACISGKKCYAVLTPELVHGNCECREQGPNSASHSVIVLVILEGKEVRVR